MRARRAWIVAVMLVCGCAPDGCLPEPPQLGERCVFHLDGGQTVSTSCGGDLVCVPDSGLCETGE